MKLQRLVPWLGGLLLIIAVIGLARLTRGPATEPPTPAVGPSLTINQHQIGLEIADEEAERVKGLSGRDSLAEGQGMLFIFESVDEHGIWMKDMRFDLDILWLDAKGRITAITTGMTPESFPQTVKPDRPAKYVLEVNAGAAEGYGWSVGQTASMQLN